MKRKLTRIFNFLEENQEFNTKVQLGFYQETFTPYKKIHDKVRSLLWRIQATQAQPRINYVANFWKGIEENNISSFDALLMNLEGDPNNRTYLNLFKTLVKRPSWGDKTAALFVRTLYHVHGDSRYSHFSFLPGTPNKLRKGDRMFLPVDVVIKNIFTTAFGEGKFDFKKINYDLLEGYSDERMAIWDDLWFWGFITQKGSGNNREFSWNNEKYWSLLHTPKDSHSISNVREKAIEFINLIKA